MALDVQRNWTVAMKESLQSLLAKRRPSAAPEAFDTSYLPSIPSVFSESPSQADRPPREPVHLPTEIIIEILNYIPPTRESQRTLYSLCLLSRQWYSCAISRLYRSPWLYGRNFDPFVRTICPSINAHVRRSPLADLVQELDLGSLVHHGSKSVTARLLGRTKANLQSFTAPQASFAINCFAALSKCARLKLLDLSLISESISLHSLAHALKSLPELHTFYFPRSSHHDDGFNAALLRWPPKLTQLALAGGIGDSFLYALVREPTNIPTTLAHLTIQHCPHVSQRGFAELLKTLAGQLTALRVGYMPAFPATAMDRIFKLGPKLESLSVSADYITDSFTIPPKPDLPGVPDYDDSGDGPVVRRRHPLRNLEITTSGHPNLDENRLRPIDLYIAVEDGFLAQLRHVRVGESVGWGADDLAAEALALSDLLRKGAQERGEKVDEEVGVFVYRDRG